MRRLLTAALVFLAPAVGSAQDGEIPRMADGRPDLRGIWQTINSANFDLEDHGAELGVSAGQSVVVGGEIPYLASALEQRRRNFENRATQDPEARCLMAGVPRVTYLPFPFQIVQTPNQVTILYEYVHSFRNIKIDSEHPPGPIQWWMGDSRARWDGDTLVVDVIHLTDQTWLDRSGNYHSDALHVVERYTMTGSDHILYEATLEDPEVYSRPWTIRMPLYRRLEPAAQILEYECYAYVELARDAEEE
ncbi:MAG TPA: hypothetical protein VIV14_03290 [Gammaproteobacteria bacterium]